MTNATLLKAKIDASGYKMKYVADRIGLTYQGFLNKIRNKTRYRSRKDIRTKAVPPFTFCCSARSAARLAPTAMNQQKFRFELRADGTVRAACGSGFYTKLDLGIVKYHFEAASGKKTV